MDLDTTAGKEKKKIKNQEWQCRGRSFSSQNASTVIIVPGYGMAVAQAQHALREMVDTLKNDIIYAVHPNSWKNARSHECSIIEANVPYDEVFELDEINNDFANTDVAFVIGANDVTNPIAKTDPQSPIYECKL